MFRWLNEEDWEIEREYGVAEMGENTLVPEQGRVFLVSFLSLSCHICSGIVQHSFPHGTLSRSLFLSICLYLVHDHTRSKMTVTRTQAGKTPKYIFPLPCPLVCAHDNQ